MKKYHKPVFVVFFLMLTSSVIQAGTGDGHIDPGENEMSELAKSTQNPIDTASSIEFYLNGEKNEIITTINNFFICSWPDGNDLWMPWHGFS